MGGAHHCSGPPVSEMTYTVSSGTLNSSIPYLTPRNTGSVLRGVSFIVIKGKSSALAEVCALLSVLLVEEEFIIRSCAADSCSK